MQYALPANARAEQAGSLQLRFLYMGTGYTKEPLEASRPNARA